MRTGSARMLVTWRVHRYSISWLRKWTRRADRCTIFDPNTGLLLVAGKPLYINNAMANFNTASSPIVLFGDFSRSLAYLDGGGMRIKILNERYADTLESAAVIYQRIGSAALLPSAVKSLVTSAS